MKKKESELLIFIFLILFSITILVILYRRININEFQIILENSNIFLLIMGVSINILLGILSGLKYSFFAKFFDIKPYPNIRTSIESFFIAATFNLILPSKLADFGRGFICNKIDKTKYPKIIHTYTLYEKINELFALLSITLTSLFLLKNLSNCIYLFQNSSCNLIIFQNKLINALIILYCICFLIINPFFSYEKFTKNISFKFKKIKKKLSFNYKNKLEKFFIYQLSNITFWLLNILQLMIFAEALEMNLYSISGMLVIGITILSGLIPISFAGIGTREIMLTILLEPFYGETKPLLFGVLFTSRYLVPAFLGLLLIKKLNIKFNYQ